MTEIKRETVGKISSDLLTKQTENISPIELEHEIHQDYEKNIEECFERCRKDFPEDFYIVVITKKEPLMQNVLRHYFVGRISCPTPDYDQTVYRYVRKTDDFSFLWVIPSRDSCFLLKENAATVDPAEYSLLEYVLKFADGTLYKLSKTLNGEDEDSILLTN